MKLRFWIVSENGINQVWYRTYERALQDRGTCGDPAETIRAEWYSDKNTTAHSMADILKLNGVIAC